ncbi:MAG TPA: hypothetical protein VFZ97_16055 [Acidimicrobiales bacterium]
MAQLLAPNPAVVDGRRVVSPDVERIDAVLRFDVRERSASGEASVDFLAGDLAGHPVLDLRQEIEWIRLDGKDLGPDAFPKMDLGGGPGAELRVLDSSLEAGTHHRLEIGYRVETPDAVDAQPLDWTDSGLRFDFWMSDLAPGRYLESWVPAPLVHDRFALNLEIEISSAERAHSLLANTAGVDAVSAGSKWRICYPAHFTALSPMLVIGPTDQLEIKRTAVSLPGRERSLGLVCGRYLDVDADISACEDDIAAWLAYMVARYGPWVHGDTFWAFLWEPGRGMEYDGATTASVLALEHEVFHSWFGRGVKPARASDGWIDEAWTSWATSSNPERPRFVATELGLDDPPVELYPRHPWARHTPRESYTEGYRLFAGLAHLFGGADRLRQAMSEWYRVNAGKSATTDGLAAHLTAWSGIDISPWWARYVHGRG